MGGSLGDSPWMAILIPVCQKHVVSLGDFDIEYGVPQGIHLGPFLFSLDMLPLGNLTNHYNVEYHCYADEKHKLPISG